MCTPKDCCRCCKRRVVNCWVGCKTPGCTWAGICRCPHGRCYTVMAVFGGAAGLGVNLSVVMSCFFQRITELNPVTGEVIPSTSHGYGLIAREIATQLGETEDDANYRTCILYPDDEYDTIKDWWITTARNMGFLAGILGFIAWIFFILAYCYLFTPWTMERWVVWIYIWASISVAFTMLMWGGSFCKENKCQVAPATGYAISSFFTYLMLANQAKSMGQPPAKENEERGMPEPGSREDDYWYDDEDERFIVDDDDDDDDDDLSDGNIEVFEDEIDDKDRKRKVGFKDPDPNEEGQFLNGKRVDTEYEDMSEFMAPEDRYAAEQDERFLENDKEKVRAQQAQAGYNQDPNDPTNAQQQAQQRPPHWRQHPPGPKQQQQQQGQETSIRQLPPPPKSSEQSNNDEEEDNSERKIV